MNSIVPFVDHEIGYRTLAFLLDLEKNGLVHIPWVFTTQTNKGGWWKSIQEFAGQKKILFFEDFPEPVGLEKPDYLLLLSWKYLLKEPWINFAKKACINLHYSLLPRHRGTYPVNWTLISGDQEAGITYHLVNRGVDAGDVLIQKKIKVGLNDTSYSLLHKLDDLAFEAFRELMQKLQDGNLEVLPQSSAAESTLHTKKDFEKICHIDLMQEGSFLDFYNMLRGLSFMPGQSLAYVEDPETGKKYGLVLKIETLE